MKNPSIVPNKKLFSSHRKPVDPCPPVACQLDDLPFDCRKKTYFMKEGVKCQGCDKNICMNKLNPFGKPFNKGNIKGIPRNNFKDVARKPVEVVEVPVRVDVPVPVEVPVSVSRRGSSSGLLPPDSVGPFDIQGQNMPNRPIRRPLNPDPVTVVNSPPSDSEFVNRVRFDRNNVNLLQPPVDQSTASGFQNSFPNTNMRQMPFQQNAQVPFQNQPGGNSWGLMNPNLQNVGQNRDMLMWQNQMAAAQFQAQQRAAQLQGQQSMGLFPGQQQTGFQNQFLPGNGRLQNIAGTQGFPNWGININPFVSGMQQQMQQPNVGLQQPGMNNNVPMQATQLLNQIPPVPGINSNFQGQASLAANSWAAPTGLLNPGQNQGMQGLSFIDPITNQALPGNSNSLHGPIN
jgi:hypothetical protein